MSQRAQGVMLLLEERRGVGSKQMEVKQKQELKVPTTGILGECGLLGCANLVGGGWRK